MASGVFSVADNPDLLVSLLENNYRAELPLTMIKGGKKIVFEALHFFFFLLYLKNFPYQYSFFNIMVVKIVP